MISLVQVNYRRARSLAIAFAILILHATLYVPFMPDDSYISLQYSKRLANGLGLTWTDGAQAVEGYSNFLWVIILSICAALGADLVTAARLLGLLGMLIVVLCLSTIPHDHEFETHEQLEANTLACLIFVSCGVTAAWSIGGLEQALLAALLAIGVHSAIRLLEEPQRQNHTVIIAFSLLALVRPDTPLFGVVAGTIVTFLLVKNYDPYQTGLRIILWTLTAFLTLTLFRLYYYGDYVPNTAHVKLSLSSHYLQQGLRYVVRGISLNFLPMLGSALFFFIAWKFDFRRSRALLLAGMLFSWLVYLIFMGGDVNPPARHFVPLVVISCFATAEFWFWLRSTAPRAWRHEARWLLPILIGLHLLLQIVDVELKDARAPRKYTQEDALLVGQHLAQAFAGADPLLAVDGAGAVPYSSNLRSLDLLGLNDWEIAHNKPAEFGQGWLGHELGSVSSILARQPDIILFGSYQGNWTGAFPGGQKLVKSDEFQKLYSRALLYNSASTITGKSFLSELWIRTEGKVGVQHSQNEISIPSYLFNPPAPAHVLSPGRLITELDQQHSFQIELPQGVWEVASLPTHHAQQLAFNLPDLPQRLALSQSTKTEIIVNTTDSILIERVTLKRIHR